MRHRQRALLAALSLLAACVLVGGSTCPAASAQPNGYTYDELFGTPSDSPPHVGDPVGETEEKPANPPTAEEEAEVADEPAIERDEEAGVEEQSEVEEEAEAPQAPEAEMGPVADVLADPETQVAEAPAVDAPAEPPNQPDAGETVAKDSHSERALQAPEPDAREEQERLITNFFLDTDLRQALSDIAMEAGVTIIPDPTAQGYVTAELQDVPLEDALRMVLLSGGFTFKKLDGYYLVGAADPTNPNFYLLSDTEVVELKYVDGRSLANYLSGPYKRYVSVEEAPALPAQRARPGATYRQAPARPQIGGTRLFITAPREIIQRIKADLAKIDVPRTQVMLEAVVLEVSEEALKEIGIDWASRWLRFASEPMAIGGNAGGSQSAETFPAGSLSYSELSFVQTAQLQALVEQGKARLRANPRVATVEGQTAEIEVGQEKYFAIVTGPVTYPYTTLEQIPAGITLRITPTVVEDTGEVIALVEPEVRDVTGKGPTGLPEITFRRATTNVRVKDGESIVIGGLVNEFATRTESKLPLLGDIPLIGNLFRRVSSRETKTEVVIIITPHILGDAGE